MSVLSKTTRGTCSDNSLEITNLKFDFIVVKFSANVLPGGFEQIAENLLWNSLNNLLRYLLRNLEI